MAAKFSKGEAVRFGWATVMGNLGVFLVAAVIFMAIYLAPAIFKSWVAMIVFWVLGMVVTLGFMRMCLKFVDGGKGELADLFSTFPIFISYIIGAILVSIAVMAGMILFIIPGIIFGLRLQFFIWVILDRGASPMDAISRSWEITRGSVWNLFLLGLLLGLVNLAGMIALGIGMLVTIPLSVVAMGRVYRQLDQAA